MYNTILFDLDGTLTDPGIGITNSVKYALSHFGIYEEDRSALYKFIGPPLLKAFSEYYGFSEEESKKALKLYREYFSTKGLYENVIYDGAKELLNHLKEQNKTVILATSKPQLFAEKILKHFDIYNFFDFISGATMDEKRTNKEDVIEYAISSYNITDVRSCLMIGDRKHDIIGAKKFNMDSCGVLYGYGSYEELKNEGATYICESISLLKNIIF